MENKKKILLISTAVVLAIGGYALTMYLVNVHQKNMAKIYKKDVEKITEDYDVFNNPKVE
jgi:flagellar basal body-associated protein FliL